MQAHAVAAPRAAVAPVVDAGPRHPVAAEVVADSEVDGSDDQARPQRPHGYPVVSGERLTPGVPTGGNPSSHAGVAGKKAAPLA
jgi:hypothetical protein